jgi:hypothetical protein
VGYDGRPVSNDEVLFLFDPQQVVFSAADGLAIHARLFLPPGMKMGERHPAVVFFRGGSRHWIEYYSGTYAMNQYLASKGYVVLSVNYRSGTGYGLDFREALLVATRERPTQTRGSKPPDILVHVLLADVGVAGDLPLTQLQLANLEVRRRLFCEDSFLSLCLPICSVYRMELGFAGGNPNLYFLCFQ